MSSTQVSFMKKTKLIVCALAVVAAAWNASAEDKAAPVQPKTSDTNVSGASVAKAKPAAQPASTDLPKVTGSLIPEKTQVRGHITVGASQVVIVDSDAIRRSGARDVADLLRRGAWTR
jgi:hypothetical protein